MIDVDGAYGEGGGQLVRTAAAAAAVTGKPFHIRNVRASRRRPGLASQHLAALRAVAGLCQARCEGLELRSTAFTFEPRARPAGGELRVEVGTAGSVTLVLQALVPVLLEARHASRVVVTGGTDVIQAPTWDYFRHVLIGLLGRLGLRVRAALVRRGYYPGGGGEVAVDIEPGRPAPFAFSTLVSPSVKGAAHVGALPLSIAERMRASALAAVPRAAIEATTEQSSGPGGAVTLWAEDAQGVLGAARVAQRGVRAETLGESAGAELAADLAAGAALDAHAADQVLVYLALARGESSFTARGLSSHARTAMWLLPQFLPVRFAVSRDGVLWRVHVLAA
jgi:RNA 3'-terminal phosphate cyclase (ATP)